MPAAQVNGFEMYYEVRGAGDPLILLHGGLGIGADWRHVFPTDPEGFRVIVPDLRGHGRSTNPSGTFTFRQCADDVLALLDQLEVEHVKAIGLSMGAKTLLHVATRQPDRVTAMVLVSAAPYFPSQVRSAMAGFTREAYTSLPAAEREVLRARHQRGGDDQCLQLYDMTRGFATSHDDMAFTPALLATIKARTLIVHGDSDPLYPVAMALELFHGIPNASLWIVPQGGHGPVFGNLAPGFAATALDHLREPAARMADVL
jgi:pimeloyl-ACP methyl ester carboxylesterase